MFLRGPLGGTEVEYYVGSPSDSGNVIFEEGNNAGKTVLGIDGSIQTSTGHVLVIQVPELPGAEEGLYDVIVRNYRPYRLKSTGSYLYHMDESVAAASYQHVVSAYGALGYAEWGTGPYGGGTP